VEYEEASHLNATLPPGSAVKQLSVFLENRVGALLSIVRLVHDLKVEVLGLSVVDSIDVTIVRLIVTDYEAVATLFMEKGIPFSETKLLVLELNDGTQSLVESLATLLEGEVNVHFSYPLLTRPHGRAALAMCVEDFDFGASVLHRAGFTLLYQEDLSR